MQTGPQNSLGRHPIPAGLTWNLRPTRNHSNLVCLAAKPTEAEYNSYVG